MAIVRNITIPKVPPHKLVAFRVPLIISVLLVLSWQIFVPRFSQSSLFLSGVYGKVTRGFVQIIICMFQDTLDSQLMIVDTTKRHCLGILLLLFKYFFVVYLLAAMGLIRQYLLRFLAQDRAILAAAFAPHEILSKGAVKKSDMLWPLQCIQATNDVCFTTLGYESGILVFTKRLQNGLFLWDGPVLHECTGIGADSSCKSGNKLKYYRYLLKCCVVLMPCSRFLLIAWS